MHSFDARPHPRVFWALLLVPPLVFWILVEGVAKSMYGGQVTMGAFLALMALAYGLPALALLWTICSVGSYTIAPGRLIVHRVVGDRTLPLADLQELRDQPDGSLRLKFGERAVVVRTEKPEACRQALEMARALTAGPAH
jgi:hypothetical protein